MSRTQKLQLTSHPKAVLNILFVIPCFLFASLGFSFSQDEIDRLATKISKELPSWNEKRVKTLIKRQGFTKLEDVISLNVTEPIQLSTRKYSHFTESYAMFVARKFRRKWRTTLRNAEMKFGVDRSVIVAILLVETSFGRISGRYNLFEVFSSTHLDSETFLATKRSEMTPKMIARMERKSKWALGELISLFKIEDKYSRLNVMNIKGSYAGAFGMAQFLPSSYLNYAVHYRKRGNKPPDLFYPPDAMYSIGNYLKKHGYQMPMGSPGSRKAIFAYNNSEVYVDTVLAVAKKLAGRTN